MLFLEVFIVTVREFWWFSCFQFSKIIQIQLNHPEGFLRFETKWMPWRYTVTSWRLCWSLQESVLTDCINLFWIWHVPDINSSLKALKSLSRFLFRGHMLSLLYFEFLMNLWFFSVFYFKFQCKCVTAKNLQPEVKRDSSRVSASLWSDGTTFTPVNNHKCNCKLFLVCVCVCI